MNHRQCILLVSLIASLLATPSFAHGQASDHSPGMAFATSLLATAVPVGVGLAHNDNLYKVSLISAGMLFGPAAGYWTGGAAGRGWKGVAFRGLVVGGTAAAVFALCNIDECDIFDDNDDATAVAFAMTLLGAGAIAASSIVDILAVPDHVRAANEERANGVSLSLGPVLLPTNGGTVGVSGQLRF